MSRKSWLEIDLNSLEEDNFLLPKRYYIVSEELADARKEVQSCENLLELRKAEMKEVEAALTISIQKDPSKFGLGSKPTAVVTSSAVLTQPKYKEIQSEYFKVREELGEAWNKVNHLQGLLSSLDKVKSGIENAIKLHGQNYYSTPYVPSTDAGRKYMDDMKKRRARVKKKSK